MSAPSAIAEVRCRVPSKGAVPVPDDAQSTGGQRAVGHANNLAPAGSSGVRAGRAQEGRGGGAAGDGML